MSSEIKRYPSIRSFRKDEASLFIGREREIKQLFNKVCAEKIVLLFARSGIGKSSLINAGLVPKLEERGFLPLYVRLSTAEGTKKEVLADTPMEIFIELLESFHQKKQYDELISKIIKTDPEYRPGLWEYVKCCNFPLAATPVFILDQFEQFFTFKRQDQDLFLEELNTLLTETVPSRFTEWLCEHGSDFREDFAQWHEQPDLRVLFAIRSDKIFELNRLTFFIPNILRNRFELYPLEDKQARDAIKIPAAKEKDNLYLSPRFTYDETLLTDIVERLKGGNNIIETTQLQIICSEIESKVILPGTDSKVLPKPENYNVKSEDLKDLGGIENIIAGFYSNQIKEIGDEQKEELARRLIEDLLYDRDNRSRKVVFAEAVSKAIDTERKSIGIPEIDENKFIAKLLDLRLIREDFRENKKFYEISHDYLLNAIGESAEIRDSRRLAEKNEELNKQNEKLNWLKDRAEESEKIAIEKQLDAEKAKAKAESAKADAERQKVKADGARLEAERQKVNADQARFEAEKQKNIAENAKLEADRNYAIARKEKEKAQYLKKRNEKYATAIFVLAVLMAGYFIYSYITLRKNKRDSDELRELYSKSLVGVFDSEAEKRYAGGERVLSYGLWDSASTFSENDSFLEKKIADRIFPAFVGSTSAMDIDVSENEELVITRNSNSKMILWKVDGHTNQVKLIASAENVSKFFLLPNNYVLAMGNDSHMDVYDPRKNFQPYLLDTTNRYSPEILPESDLLVVYSKTTNGIKFFHLSDLTPFTPLDDWYKNETIKFKKKQALQSDAPENSYTFTSVGNDDLMITSFDQDAEHNNYAVLFNLKNKTFSSPVRLPTDMSTPELINGKKILTISNDKIAFFDVFTGKSEETKIEAGTSYVSPEILGADEFLLTQNGDIFDTSQHFVVYEMTKMKKIKQKIFFVQMQLDKQRSFLAYTEFDSTFHLYDVKADKDIFSKKSVQEFSLDIKTQRVFLETDSNAWLEVGYRSQQLAIQEHKGKFPFGVYGNNFFLVPIQESASVSATRRPIYALQFQDSTKNDLINLKALFKEYITAEIIKLTHQ